MKTPQNIVSTKLAIYSHDLRRVLVMRRAPHDVDGLPGGYVNKNESPDVALRRGLIDGLNLEVDHIHRRDFFLREGISGLLVLAYIAVATENMQLQSTQPDKEFAEWVDKDDVDSIENMSGEYKQFILENWPELQV